MALEKRHETLLSDLEDLDFRHLTIDRFACIVAQPERTAKGNIDQAALQKHYHDILEILCGRKQHYPGVVFLERDRLLSSANARFTSPRKSKMLELASLDKSYVSALGDKLSYTEGGAEKEVVDFVGGFGAGLLGHRHPELIAIAQEFLGGAAPLLCDQGSARDYQGQLARRLSLMVGRYTGSSYVVRFGSTGAEAVEMALLHAFQERAQFILQLHRDLEQSYVHSHPDEVRDCIAHNNALLAQTPPKIIAIQGAFHGHSLGARAVLAQTSKREPFLPLLRVETIFVSPDAASNELDTLLARESLPLRLLKREQGEIIRTEETISSVFAAIAEPLRGEGGILPVSSALLKKLASSRFPLIMDEIQTGLGRTGRFLASEESPGHYFLFSKSLGGGVAKISALLIERNRYIERFDDDYSSTFAGDSFSCAMATRTLEIIERDDLPSRAHERGQTLRRALEEVQREYPHIVGAIRGEGLMLGVEFTPSRITNNAIWRGLNRQKLFGAAAASYLLNCHQVRVLPTLSAPNVLRVEPSAYIDDASIRQLARGLREFCHGIVQERMDQLLAHLVDKDREQVMANRQSRVEEFDLLDNCDASTPHALLPSVGQSVGTTTAQRSPAAAHRIPHMRCVLEEPNPGAIRVAFINHFVYPERELVMAEPSMARLSEMARRALFHRLMEMMEFKALPAFGRNLMNGQVWFLSLSLAIDAATLEALHREQELQEIHKAIRDAVQYARDEGCRIIALGGYTSILT
ncbi:MAG: aminotransferase class III-fold pyridoxal phosphate-dependent enzyme, partial [Deltaproteobacteria bacterium]|nr:aminotransferase class III-fold pyridoxal phosphate-dependent enzyme [Deltaproteobacteria bacterium]